MKREAVLTSLNSVKASIDRYEAHLAACQAREDEVWQEDQGLDQGSNPNEGQDDDVVVEGEE